MLDERVPRDVLAAAAVAGAEGSWEDRWGRGKAWTFAGRLGLGRGLPGDSDPLAIQLPSRESRFLGAFRREIRADIDLFESAHPGRLPGPRIRVGWIFRPLIKLLIILQINLAGVTSPGEFLVYISRPTEISGSSSYCFLLKGKEGNGETEVERTCACLRWLSVLSA